MNVSHPRPKKIRHLQNRIESFSPIGTFIYIPSSTFYRAIVTTANYARIMNTTPNDNDESIANAPYHPTTEDIPITSSPPIANNRSVDSLTSLASSSSSNLPIATNAASILRTPPTATTATTDDNDPFRTIRIVDTEWDQRLQDVGCAKDALPSKTYKRGQIPPIGPHGMELYYYNLAAIAIDYLKIFANEHTCGRGWAKVPKNKTDAKVKIIGVLLAIRKEDENGVFKLEQNRILSMLSNMWGRGKAVNQIHFNDRIRLYGLIMSVSANRHIYQRLAEGCTARRHVDDPVFNSKEMFQSLALMFNNERVMVTLPPDYYQLGDTRGIDPNDPT